MKDALLASYRRSRREFFSRHGARWPGTLADEFDILDPCILSRSEADEILDAAGSLARIYSRAAQLLRTCSDEALSELGVPAYLLPVVRCVLPGVADCVVGRFDLAHTRDGYKLLEFNADGPGLLVEAFSINAEVCRDAGKEDPNEGDESILAGALSEAIQAGRDYVGKSARGGANVVVTSAGHCVRDGAIGRYLCQLMEPFSAQYAAIESLAIDADGLYDPGGNRIDVLYRLFPLQLFRNELFQARGTSIGPEMGGAVLRLVERRQLAVINPPFSFLLEGKALQALIWNLADSNIFFTEEERRLIARYMLPTYLDPPIDDSAYVVKPSYGAEGDSVTLMAAGGTVMSQAMCTTYSDRPMVYQKHVELPAPERMTEFGPRKLHVVTSCFLISGKPAGICMRAGDCITDESAWVLPVCIGSATH